jgi:predicted enzyme related to lactoylglutathione lyase
VIEEPKDMTERERIGVIGWIDLTVPNAPAVRDFYQAVVGWAAAPVKMGDYDDFCMNQPATGKPIAGVCHARGVNVGLPRQWLIYITVADVDTSATKAVELGGKVLAGPRELGGQGRFCVIQDPAGAVAALFCPK